MQLLIFDVDGTLTRSNEVDGRCFAQAASGVFGAPVSTDWSAYRHQTDSGILQELLERNGSPPLGAAAVFPDFMRRDFVMEQLLAVGPTRRG